MLSKGYQEGMNEIVGAFADGVIAEGRKTLSEEDIASSVVAALLDKAVQMMLDRGMGAREIEEVISNHAALLRDIRKVARKKAVH